MKIELSEFLEEVKEELLCYEDIGETGMKRWTEEFQEWLADKKTDKKKSIKEEKGKKYFVIKDEDEIMEIAASYCDALEENSVKDYWKKFK